MRLFTFGCSYTSYIWPTWADVIANDLDVEYYNYGFSGLGNQGIQSRIVEADMRHNLTSDDIVLIFWSSWSREDRFLDNHWATGGSVFNNTFYDEDFINRYWSWENDIIKNSTAIHMTNKAYKDIIKFQGSMTVFPTLHNNTDIILMKLLNKVLHLDDPITKFYRDKLEMPECWNLTKTPYSQFSNSCHDPHPDVNEHLKYVESVIYPKLGYTLKDSTKKMFNEIHDGIRQVFKLEDDGLTLRKKSSQVVSKYNLKQSNI